MLSANEITKVLRDEWDPIGLSRWEDLPEDEYEDYSTEVLSILSKGDRTRPQIYITYFIATRTMEKTNKRQFELNVVGPRKPRLGETFDIEILPRRNRLEVECVDMEGDKFLVEVTNDHADVPQDGIRSRVIPV